MNAARSPCSRRRVQRISPWNVSNVLPADWMLAHAGSRAAAMQLVRNTKVLRACGLGPDGGDLLLATLGERQVESTTAASAVVRLRVSADGKLRRMGEMIIPNGDASCGMLDASQPDVAYFATASSPAALVKIDTAKWSDASLLATLLLDSSDGPVLSCALDEKRHLAYLLPAPRWRRPP